MSVPTADAADLLTDLDDVEVIVWDGLGPAPHGAHRVELFVGLYNAAPPARETLAGLPALRVIQLLSAGVEPWLPIVPDGVLLCSGRGIHGSSTAELAVAGMLGVLRDIPHFVRQQARHDWDRAGGRGLDGARVLVLGAGDIGRRVAEIARILDAEVTLVARTARDGVHAMADLPQLLPHHDVVVVALPLTPETDRLVDAEFLAAVPDGGLVVNIARGRIVDTEALFAELTAGRLHAFLDVTEPEPLPADHPLWDAPNLLLTPHVGGGSRGWRRRAYRLVREQVQRLLDGAELENRVTAGY